MYQSFSSRFLRGNLRTQRFIEETSVANVPEPLKVLGGILWGILWKCLSFSKDFYVTHIATGFFLRNLEENRPRHRLA